ESRIILDQAGAEKLVGMGDMLYAPVGSGKPTRIQGAFVSDEEREDVINFIKEDTVPDYDEQIMSTIERTVADKEKSAPEETESGSTDGSPFADYDELLPQAVEVLLDTKQASVSMLQRRLKLGYSRAARLVDQMEELGIVGPFEGSKPRQLLITREQWQEMSMTGNTAVEKLMNEQKDDFSEGYGAE
ncbi:MAG: DNA translocase FtsK, partial [Oscillospiraceae bacterium]|nr:DNA translocase FtsK [Oscillospiraceae bacterium]